MYIPPLAVSRSATVTNEPQNETTNQKTRATRATLRRTCDRAKHLKRFPAFFLSPTTPTNPRYAARLLVGASRDAPRHLTSRGNISMTHDMTGAFECRGSLNRRNYTRVKIVVLRDVYNITLEP